MKLSVIIPTLNEAQNIGLAVQSAWDAGAAEVLVVDAGSKDATAEQALSSGARVLANGLGRAAQQNHGAGAATGDLFLFLHADCRLAPDARRQIATALADQDVLGGAFRQRIDADGWLYRWLERGNAARVRWLGMPYGDQAIFMRRAVFEQLGGFPKVKLMEDLLLMRSFRRFAHPLLLPGPLTVSPRRWQQQGVVRQTLRNWSLVAAHRFGVSPDRLSRFYPPHGGRGET